MKVSSTTKEKIMTHVDLISTAMVAALVAFASVGTIIEIAKDGFGPVPTRWR